MTEPNGATQAQQTMPMFYTKPEPLNPTRHAGLRLASRPDYSFAEKSHAVPLVANEMPMAMRSYPIVFVGPQKMPIAIIGVRRDENLFVEPDGSWTPPHYVPAYIRRVPFILAGDEKADRLTLCIDRDNSRVIEQAMAPLVEGKGELSPLFDGIEPTETTKKALEFCQQYQQGVVVTRAIIEKITALNLFTERRSTITLDGGEQLNLTDFNVIDEAALNKLPDADFLELRRSGALAMIYCHLASMNSWSSLVFQAAQRKR